MLLVRELWASLATAAIWIAVAVGAALGLGVRLDQGVGSQTTTIPSGIAVALFAVVAHGRSRSTASVPSDGRD